MKKWIAALLFVIMLAQALPLEALAVVGKVMSEEEMERAYALTGLGTGGLVANNGTGYDGTYHAGMMPNAHWNASQLMDWLEVRLSEDLGNINSILSGAAFTLADLKENAPETYEQFMKGSSAANAQELYVRAEELREELRLLQKRLVSNSNIIAENSALLQAEGDSLFDSDQVRYSAQIEIAAKEIESIRETIVDKSAEWADEIDYIERHLRWGPAADEDEPWAGEWLSELEWQSDINTNTVPVSTVTGSSSRMSRLSTNVGLSSNDAEATVTVITENQVAISLIAGDKMERVGVKGVPVIVGDALNPDNPPSTFYSSEATGVVVLPVNQFKADEFDIIHLTLQIDPREQGYQDYAVDDLDLEKGEIFTHTLIPIDGGAQGDSANAEPTKPYIYKMELNGKDIMASKYEMTFSEVNDYNFDIKVEIRNPSGQQLPDLVMSWYEGDGGLQLKKKYADATRHEGNVYTFTGPWKKRFSPFADKDQRPTFSFGRDADPSLTFPSQLVSKKSATQQPLNEGTGMGGGVFGQVLGKGLGMTFTIPGVDLKVNVNLPFKDYLPKLTIDPGGYVTIFMGSPVLEDMVKKAKVNWQSKDQRLYSQAQSWVERKGMLSNYAAQYNMTKDYFKSKFWKLLGESKINVGVFGLATGRWQLDSSIPDVKTTEISLQLGSGMTLAYSYSWTISYPIGPVPVYVCFTLSISAGFALQHMISFCWVNGGFQNWTVKPFKNITLFFTVGFSAQLGVGIKGFLEAWVKLTATFSVIIVLSITGDDPADVMVNFGASWGVGVTIFWVTISKFWDITKRQIYPPVDSNNLLQKYMYEGNDSQQVPAGQGEPDDYPDLVVDATAIKEDVEHGKAGLKVAEAGGQPYMFYLAPARGTNGQTHGRVHWVNIKNGATGSVQADVDQRGLDKTRVRDDYAFDVYSANGFIYLVATCARDFDENGYPVRNDFKQHEGNINAWTYYMMLEPRSDGTLSSALTYTLNDKKTKYFCGESVVRQGDPSLGLWMDSYDTATNPHIAFAEAKGKNDSKKTIDQVFINGEYSTVSYEADQAPVGATVFILQSSYQIRFFTDKNTRCGKGDGYERTQVCSTMAGEYDIYSFMDRYSPSFIGLCRPKDGKEGVSSIDMFDFRLNGISDASNRRAIPIDEGEIDFIRTVMGKRDDGWTSTVFYAVREANGDGVDRYRLFSLFVEPVEKADNNNASFKVTKFQHDVVLPTNQFDVVYLGNTPYLYWTAASGDEDEHVEDPTNWRVWAVAYDPSTGLMASPSVFAQFKLPLATGFDDDGNFMNYSFAPHTLLLSPGGTGYMVAVPATQIYPDPEEEVFQLPETISLFSFPERLTPSANITAAVPQQLAVKAGNFEDIVLGVMNDGNMGISTMDVAMYQVVNGRASTTPIGTVHINSIEPEKSKLTLPNSKVELTGEQAAFREEDYNYSSRQYDWVLDQVTKRYNISMTRSIDVKSVDVLDPSSPRYVKTSVLLPGSLGTYTAVYKIPEEWSGDKTLRLKVTGVSVESNWVHAIANAAGLEVNGLVANAPQSAELKYVLNERTGKLELQVPPSANAALKNAIETGLVANEIDSTSTDVMVSVQDFSVKHRVYEGYDGRDWLDIVIRNHAASRESYRLTCAVYVDGSNQPNYINLPYYQDLTASRRTQTISLPVSALVDDPSKHRLARVVISVVGSDENAYADNEFDIEFDGADELRFARQPMDATVQEGEDVSFQVEVAGGSQPYRYQWQAYNPKTGKWTDISGFTDPVMAREKIEKKWDGARFRCVVTDAQGTQIVSREVKLTVRDRIPTGDDSQLPLYLIVALIALAALWLLRRRREAASGNWNK